MPDLEIRPGTLTLSDLRQLAAGGRTIALTRESWPRIDASARTVAEVVARGAPVYGINTGFGILARQRIAAEDVDELQRRLVRSHAVGTGEPLPDATVRLILALKVNALARGHSGVRRPVIE